MEDFIPDYRVGESSEFFDLLLVSLEAGFAGLYILQESPDSSTERSELNSSADYTQDFSHDHFPAHFELKCKVKIRFCPWQGFLAILWKFFGSFTEVVVICAGSSHSSNLLEEKYTALGLFKRWRMQMIQA